MILWVGGLCLDGWIEPGFALLGREAYLRLFMILTVWNCI